METTMVPKEIEDKIKFKSRLSKIFEKAPSGEEYLDAVHMTVHGSAMLPIKEIPSDPKGIRGSMNIEQHFEYDWTVAVRVRDNDPSELLESYKSSRPFLHSKHVVTSAIHEKWLAARAKAAGVEFHIYEREWRNAQIRALHAEHDGHPTTITRHRPRQGFTVTKS
jgi:hypothetical protein